jgi:sulfate transport system permease protein
VADLTATAVAVAEQPAGTASGARPTAGSLTLRGIAVLYVGVLVLVPLAVILYRTFQPGLSTVGTALTDHNAVHAYQVTAIVAGCAVVLNTVFGVAVGVLLARYRFWGSRLLNAFIDLPVAVSPIVVGLALVLVFGPTGWFGPFLDDHGVHVIAAKPGMVLATVFVSLPLVVRAVVPVLQQAGLEQEQAAASLGADAVTRFRRITLPTIRTALTYGVVLSIARCLGEYGAVLVVSNNIEGQTETVTLRIGNKVELSQDYQSAYALTLLLILVSFVAIGVSAWIRRRRKES